MLKEIRSRILSWDIISLIIAFALTVYMLLPIIYNMSWYMMIITVVVVYVAAVISCGDEHYEGSTLCKS